MEYLHTLKPAVVHGDLRAVRHEILLKFIINLDSGRSQMS